MKKFFTTAVVATALMAALTPAFSAPKEQEYIGVIVNGKAIRPLQQPVMEKGYTLVPMRSIFDALGAEVKYDAATKTIKATRDKTTIELTLNSTEAIVNGKLVTLQLPAKSMSGTTMVPLRFVGEAMGAEVYWHGGERVIRVASAEYLNTLRITDRYKDSDFDYLEELDRLVCDSYAGLKEVQTKDNQSTQFKRTTVSDYSVAKISSSERDAILGALDIDKDEVQDLACRLVANYNKARKYRIQLLYLLAVLGGDPKGEFFDEGTRTHIQTFMRDKMLNGDPKLSDTDNNNMRRHMIIALCTFQHVDPFMVDSVLQLFETSNNNYALSPVPIFLKLHAEEIKKMPDIDKYRDRLDAVNNLFSDEARQALE